MEALKSGNIVLRFLLELAGDLRCRVAALLFRERTLLAVLLAARYVVNSRRLVR